MDLSPELHHALTAALAGPPRRIRAIEAGGQCIWLKQAENLSLRWRLQKGDSRRAFENDRQGLHLLSAEGLPVPPILAEGDDYFATPDVGVPLKDVIRDTGRQTTPLAAAGAALGALHSAGYSHGRPSIRDICWDGRTARLIDFERFTPERHQIRAQGLDVLIFVHSLFAYGEGAGPGRAAAIAGYRDSAPATAWQAAGSRARRLRWLRPLIAALRRLRPNSRDLNAAEQTLHYFNSPAEG